MFTLNYDDIEEDPVEIEPKSAKKEPNHESILDIEIPRFRHKLFDSKKFGSPTLNKTPTSKGDINIDEFKTPTISRILAERKTPFGEFASSARKLVGCKTVGIFVQYLNLRQNSFTHF